MPRWSDWGFVVLSVVMAFGGCSGFEVLGAGICDRAGVGANSTRRIWNLRQDGVGLLSRLWRAGQRGERRELNSHLPGQNRTLYH